MRNLILSLRFVPVAVVMFWAISPSAQADFIPAESLVTLNLQGTTETSIWSDLSANALSGTGGFPGTAMWGPQNSQAGGGNGQLIKIANSPSPGFGGPYAASASIYYGGVNTEPNFNGGTLAVQDLSPVSGLEQVAFQIQIGEVWGYDFFDDVAPVLNLQTSGGNVSVTATGSQLLDQFYNGTVMVPDGEEDTYINIYLYDWDLSGISDSIDSFSVEWTAVQHAQLYALQLDQGSIYTSLNSDPTAVPEPSTLVLLGSCALFGVPAEIRRRRKQAQTQASETDTLTA